MKKILFMLVVLSIFLFGCASASIEDIKKNPEKFMGKTLYLKGTTSGSIKLGGLSGFTLEQNGHKISVSSKTLPEDGSKVVVKGTVMKDTIFGTYILASEVR